MRHTQAHQNKSFKLYDEYVWYLEVLGIKAILSFISFGCIEK
jgi:hypothetical protein